MQQRPTLHTARLLLRPFTRDDAPVVQQLANDREIAANTLGIPYPYEDGMAAQWINGHQTLYENNGDLVFAIVRNADHTLIGGVGLHPQPHDRAEIGYWLGRAYWNDGYVTEAASEIVRFGFEELKLNRIYASHFARNPASGRAMQKIGMTHEGCLRQHIKKWDAYEDLECYGILRSEYQART